MSIDNQHYLPGDIVNGHRLSADGTVWEPIAAVPAAGDRASEQGGRGSATAGLQETGILTHGAMGAPVLDQVRQRLGGLSADEESVLYGMTFANSISTHGRALDPAEGEVLLATLVRFRTAPCAFCGRGMSAHSLDLEDSGLGVRCHDSDDPRPAADWLAGPVRTPVWRVFAGIVLWGGIPAISLGLASWLMPLVSAVIWRDRRWGRAAALWGVATAVLLALPLTVSSDNPAASLYVFGTWVGSMVYGLVQVRRWLRVLPAPRKRHPLGADGTRPALPGAAEAVQPPTDASPDQAPASSSPPRSGDAVAAASGTGAAAANRDGEPKVGFWERVRRFFAERAYRKARHEWHEQLMLLYQARDWSTQAAGAATSARRQPELTLLETRGTLVEPRREPGRYSGGSAGVSVPLGLGVRGRVGSSSGTYTPGKEVQSNIDSGQVTVTTRRVLFAGPLATREWRVDRLVEGAVGRHGSSILLPVTNRQKTSGVTVPNPGRLLTAVWVATALQDHDPSEVLAEINSEIADHEERKPARPPHLAEV